MGATASAQAQMQQEHDNSYGFPWWVRLFAKGVGVVGGFVAMFFAVLGFFTFQASCIAAVLVQLVIGFLIIALEAPFCCAFVDFIEKIATFSESRAYWQKGLLYVIMGLIPIVMCAELNTILGGGMIFASGAIYGFMALGKKADRSSMMQAGGGHPTDGSAWDPKVGNTNIRPPPYGQP